MARLNTRIILKNDVIADWENADSLSLHQGEVALAKNDNDTYELRVGQEGKQWKEALPLQLSASQIVGLETKLNDVTTSNYVGVTTLNPQAASSDEITAEAVRISGKAATEFKKGDTLILKELIAGEGETAKYQHAAYVWNGDAWAAMDGTYNADSIYFDEDLTYTAAIGVLAKPAGSAKISAQGKDLETVLKSILASPSPAKKTADVAFTFTTSNLTGEVGTTFNAPVATLKMTATGTYQYPPTVANCSVEIGDASVSASYMTAARTNDTAIKLNNTLATNNAPTGVTYLSTDIKYYFTASAKYTDGVVPCNNLGTEDTTVQIKGSTYTKTDLSAKATGYFPAYFGKFDSKQFADPENLTSADVVNYTGTTVTAKTGFTKEVRTDNLVTQKGTKDAGTFENYTMQQLFWIAKKGLITSVYARQNDPAAFCGTVKKAAKSLVLPTANGYADVEYDVWYIDNGVAAANGYAWMLNGSSSNW